jgi:hypothetical protein
VSEQRHQHSCTLECFIVAAQARHTAACITAASSCCHPVGSLGTCSCLLLVYPGISLHQSSYAVGLANASWRWGSMRELSSQRATAA